MSMAMAPKSTPLRPAAGYSKTEADSTTVEPASRFNQRPSALFRQRIGTKLEVDDLAHLAFAALDMGGGPIGEGGPQALALPTRGHVVEAPVHPLGEIADWVRHAHHDPFAVHDGRERIGLIARGDRYVLAESKGAVLIPPIVIARFGGRAGRSLRQAFELRPRHLIELPPFRTEILRIGQSRSRQLALAEPA